ncbi:cytochrome b [Roseitranquillus sediminis]|uniref:cytochrome b n=1 Tax=Roseitranquillus sediminis TaxID=2809051 RepID=UPI001D0C0415|nr:cytochrome b/b6 domain-containing protein [Roseitranquillus sediminis]MBM9595384.1 cytochrome b [Roseitranquillus sediminis]
MSAAATGYRTTARLLHWLVALLILSTLPVGQAMVQEGLSRPVQDALFIYHKNVGVIILLLMLLRLGYRLTHRAPPLPPHMPDWQRIVARTTHVALYVLVFVQAISGYVRVEAGGFPIEMLDALGVPPLVPRSEPLADAAKATHAVTRLLLVPVILLHIGAALQHALWQRDGVFSRMWPPIAR